MLESGQDREIAALITSFCVCFYFTQNNVPRETQVYKNKMKGNVPRETYVYKNKKKGNVPRETQY